MCQQTGTQSLVRVYIIYGCGVAIMNRRIIYRHLLTNRLHGNAAGRMSFYRMVLVKFYYDVINRSRLQLINFSIDTFFSAFLAEQRRRKANDG